MRAALYFESVEGFGQWRILISGRADKNLRELRKEDKKQFGIVLKKIKELSNGHFSDDNQKRLTGVSIPVPIYEAKMTRDSRLVYQVDCVPEFDSHVERQVIRVFGIYTHAQLDKRLWDSMGYQLSRKGKEYQKRCTFRSNPVHKGDKVVPPASFPPAPEVPDSKMIPDEFPTTGDDVLEEALLTSITSAFICLRLDTDTPKGILANQDVVHVFQVSPHEQEIIEHTRSCFVQGRSGTGKTTTMLFKMLGIENSWQQNRELRPERPRQLFVTQSRVLADKVEEYFIKLLQSLVMAVNTEGNISELLERQKNREEAGLIDRDEAVDWREDLPAKFSGLQDSHFPMFITFDKLSAMIEADINLGDTLTDNAGTSQHATSSEYILQRKKLFVSFDVFREEYWAHFPQNLTRGLDVSLVFSEFMGVIKGSEQTLASEAYSLDYDTYLSLSSRTQSTFANRRGDIYALFEAYLKIKRERGEYDAPDRTHRILRSISQNGTQGQKIDFLYVDEVQDNLLIDAKLLRAICHNPDGQFWAGDTAQTISVGSSFRFDDLKAFLHRNEASFFPQTYQTPTSHQPKSFQLVTNFRSHGGIVKCAHSIIALITKFWPYAIDALPEEKGVVDGIKPVWFTGWDEDNVRYESFLFGTAGNQIEFGAQQCILVRNDIARDNLRKQVGDVGLIMTLYESKGLEFNDVLLYNFFEDSAVDVSQWRVILNAVEKAQRAKIPAPTFDESRHAGVCSELKFLYVAVTRARKNLWIVDRSDTGEPMRTYWSSKNLVQNCTPGTDVPQLAVSSSPEEWAKMARTLFSHKRYFQAMHSYDRAGMPREKAISHAYSLREQARGIPQNRSGNNARHDAYAMVAKAFMVSARDATIVRERTEYFRIAAEAYLVLEDHAKAAHAYEQGSRFTEAAQHYRKAGMFDNAVSVIKNHGSAMDASVASKLTDVARYFYLQRGELKKASALFSDVEEELEFVRDCDLDVAEVNILVEQGKFSDAADLHIREDRPLEAVEVLLRDKASRTAAERAANTMLDALWGILSFGVLPSDLDDGSRAKLKRLMELVELLDVSLIEGAAMREFEMFRAIYEGDVARLLSLAERILLLDDRKDAALLCLDHVFRAQDQPKGSDTQILHIAKAFYSFVDLLQQVLFFPAPWSQSRIRRLFSFSVTPEGRVCLLRGTFLHSCYVTSQRHSPEEDVMAGFAVFHSLYRVVVGQRLRERIETFSSKSLRVHMLEPCEVFAATGKCDHGPDCARIHVLDQIWFDRRLQFHVLQILILASRRMLGGPRLSLYWIWFERLSSVLSPVHSSFGNAMDALNPNSQTKRAWDLLMTHWIWPALANADPYNDDFLLEFWRSIDLGWFINSRAVVEHVNRTALIQQYRHPRLMRNAFGAYAISELVDFLDGQKYSSIHAGILSIQHILRQKIIIDIIGLCRIFELIVGSFVMASKLRSSRSFHNVMLPRSWILDNIRRPERLHNKDTRLGNLVVEPFSDLLEQIYSCKSSDHIIYQNKPISSASQRVRNIVMARLCRVVCLLGYNTNIPPLKTSILRSLNSLQKTDPSRPFSSLYKEYIYAPNWVELARVVTTSLPPTPLEEMITLADENKPPLKPFAGVRLVKFRSLDDIFRQLTSATPALNPTATTFVPIQARPQAKDVERPASATPEGLDDGDLAREDQHEEDAEASKEADVAAAIDSIDSSVAVITEDVVTKQHAAAEVFQSHYRRLVVRRASRITKPGLPTTRQMEFEAFGKAADSIQWPTKSLYKFIFLGPLPHLLVCLDYLWSVLQEEKAKVKKRAAHLKAKKQHEGIEELMERRTSIRSAVQRVETLQKMLNATSAFHQRRDLEELKSYVARVSDVINDPEVSQTKEDLAFDMFIAYKGIVQERQRPKQERPVLNTEDILDVAL
ncbi:hypothetical protein BC834DRAFT_835038 [Gloeopeniophorella convolvens]|nr:hypothetical protein BC834DRAFT_835038 [Gloeopeniophorella convolvens]